MGKRIHSKSERLEILYGMPDTYRECREGGHRLDPYDAVKLPKNEGWIELKRCTRCGVERIRRLDSAGYIVGSRYSYSNVTGYLLAGLGRLDRDDRGALRLDAIQTIIEHRGQ